MSLKPLDLPQHDGIPEYLISSDSQPMHIELNIHGPMNIIYPRPDPQQFQENPGQLSNHQFNFVRWGCWYIFVAFFAFAVLNLSRHWDNKLHGLEDCAVCRQPGHSGVIASCGPDKDSQFSPLDVTDASSDHPIKRGKQSAAEARTEESSRPSPPLWILAESIIDEDEKNKSDGDVANLESAAAAQSTSSCRNLSATVQIPSPQPLHSDDQPVTPSTAPIASTGPRAKQSGSFSILELTNTDGSESYLQPQTLSSSSVYDHGGLHSTEAPLRTSLCDSLGSHSASLIPLFMLVIAVNLEHLQDPEHDLEFLQGMIKQSKINNIHFEGLPGGKATLSKIKKRIRFLYRKARETSGYSNLLILFTGLGDTKNRMRLHNREVMTVKALKRWLLRLRAESTTTQPVTLVFDICRWTKGKKCTKMHKDVSLIWSCAPGQGAHALRFKSRNDIPRSCFLIAFLMSSCDSPTSRSFEDAMGQRMGQLVAFLKYVYKAGHVETCKNCQSQRPCDNTEDPELSSQNPDWEQAGDTFFKLAGLLSRHYPEPAQRVYRLFMGNSIFCKANNLPSPPPTKPEPNYAPPLADHTSRHKRGANEPVHML